jgi:hypothetical protein
MAAFYYFTNPYWYGDGVVYAAEIASAKDAVPIDGRHLAWLPLGKGLWTVVKAFFPKLDPLIIFRALSSAATAALLVFSYRVCTRLGLGRGFGLAVAGMLAGSHMCLAYGGSGCPYTAAMAFGSASLLPLLRPPGEEWKLRHGVLSASLFVIGWACWGVAMLLLPSVFIAAVLFSRGTMVGRVFRGIVLCAGIVVVAGLVVLGAFALTAGGKGFSEWLQLGLSAEKPGLSVLAAYRAVYGFCASFFYLGRLGTSIKGLIIGDPSIVKKTALVVNAAILGPFAAVIVLSVTRLVSMLRRRMPGAWSLSLLFATVFLPVAAFAATWKGSDVERFSLGLPLTCLTVVYGIAGGAGGAVGARTRWSRCAPYALAGYISLINLGALVVPALATRGGVVMELGRVASTHVNKASIIIFSGQNLGYRGQDNVRYFAGIRAYNIMAHVNTFGVDGWDTSLAKAIDESLGRGGTVAVLSDLLGKPTPGGIGLSYKEYPTPSLGQTESFFRGWKEVRTWSVGPYVFVELEPPDGWKSRFGSP